MATPQRRRLILPQREKRLFFDSFTDVDGTPLASHKPEVGGPWTVLSGVWAINGNAATAGATDQYSSTPMGASDLIIAGTLRYSAGVRNLGWVLRASDVGNLWVAYLAVSTLVLYERVASVLAAKMTVAVPTGAINTDYRLAARLNGPTIDLWLNGTQYLSYPSATSNQTVQKHGMVISGGNAAQSIPDIVALPVSANPATA